MKVSADCISNSVVCCSFIADLVENGVVKKLIPSDSIILFVGQHALD